MKRPRAIYIHVPFCQTKCAYCAFLSVVVAPDVHERYIDAVAEELKRRAAGLRPRTIYVGGGTPTLLEPRSLERLFAALAETCDLSGLREFTVEANPGALDREKVRTLKRGGVNRVSLGAQTFQDEILQRLGRAHTAEQLRTAVERLRSEGFENISLDLIFGVPGQRIESVAGDVEEVIRLKPAHVSTYCLTVEKGTLIAALIESGSLEPVSDDAQRKMYGRITRRLTRAGFIHYEISNFALPRRRSAHNLAYWRNEPYLGIGLGAVSYDGAVRSANTRDIEKYCRGLFGPGESEELPARKAAQEALILGLRLTGGISTQALYSRTGFKLEDLLNDDVRDLIERGFLLWNGKRLRLARKALFVSDEILQHFLD